jgi:hypothetical protein
MKASGQSALLALLLAGAGITMILYKHLALGFPLFAQETQTIWKIETRLDFETSGGEITARLNLPDPLPGRNVIFASETSPGFVYEVKEKDDDQYAKWSRLEAPPGSYSIYLSSELYFPTVPTPGSKTPPEIHEPDFSGMDASAFENASAILSEKNLTHQQLVLSVLQEINNPASGYLGSLLRQRGDRSQKVHLAIDLLAAQDIATQMVRGILLEDRSSNRSARFMLKAYYDKQWHLFDPREVSPVGWDQFVEFQQGDKPLFEVYGGENSNLRFSMIREERASFMTAVEEARNNSNVLVDFSIYSLPIQQQSAFKLLLLMPLGALVVVILRNLVGIRTSGTFMPILIALSFLQTGLGVGLVLFLLVVSTGLVIRSLMTHLNLLLVPRIASVLVFVIIIYAAIGIAGHKLGFEWGLNVIFFPMIILSWTIERMSILWDEEGPKEVALQGGGSLLTASLAFLLMSSQFVADSIFLYPESLLILLAIIISIGSYSGYRLSDLRRFEPMERY